MLTLGTNATAQTTEKNDSTDTKKVKTVLGIDYKNVVGASTDFKTIKFSDIARLNGHAAFEKTAPMVILI